MEPLNMPEALKWADIKHILVSTCPPVNIISPQLVKATTNLFPPPWTESACSRIWQRSDGQKRRSPGPEGNRLWMVSIQNWSGALAPGPPRHLRRFTSPSRTLMYTKRRLQLQGWIREVHSGKFHSDHFQLLPPHCCPVHPQSAMGTLLGYPDESEKMYNYWEIFDFKCFF